MPSQWVRFVFVGVLCLTVSHYGLTQLSLRKFNPPSLVPSWSCWCLFLADSTNLHAELCPDRALRCYFDWTAAFRTTDQLFVCYAYESTGRDVPYSVHCHLTRAQAHPKFSSMPFFSSVVDQSQGVAGNHISLPHPPIHIPFLLAQSWFPMVSGLANLYKLT